MNLFKTIASILYSAPSIVMDVERVYSDKDGATKRAAAIQLIGDGLGIFTALVGKGTSSVESIKHDIGQIVDAVVSLLNSIGELFHKPPEVPVVSAAQALRDKQDLQTATAASSQSSSAGSGAGSSDTSSTSNMGGGTSTV